MGLNSCICLRNLDELSAETALNGDGEIEGFNFPNTNNQNASSTDYSSKLKGAGRMSYLMKVNTIDSGILKSNAFYNLKGVPAAVKIQSIFRGYNFRKNFQKKNEKLSKKNLVNKNYELEKKIEEEKKEDNNIKNNEIIENKKEGNNIKESQKESSNKNSLKINSKISHNFSSESDEKKINNKNNKEKILINNIKENEDSIKEREDNNDSDDFESSENSNKISNKVKNFSQGHKLPKSNKINDSTKLNYVKKGSKNSSNDNSQNEENSINKNIENNEIIHSLSSWQKRSGSSNSENRSNKNNKKEVIEEIINTDIKPENKNRNEDEIKNFIPEKTKLAEKNFDKEIDYGKDWKQYIDEDTNSNDSERSFFQAKLNDEIKNSSNLITTNPSGELLTINKEKCLFIGQYDDSEYSESNFILKGKGCLYYKNGVKYEGIFIKNKLNGIGRYITDKGICYEGIFKKGNLQKKGMQITTDEEGNKVIYKGTLINYKKEGKGVLESKTFKYEGDFKNDKRNGKGLIKYKDNGNIYEGDFLDDNIHGYGIYTFKNKQEYEGQVVNGVFHGKGTYKWTDGSYFIGEYINGSREGIGEYKFSDGKIYNGPFMKGKPHGKGKLNIKGKIYDCEFKYGKLMTDIKSFVSAKKKSKG